MSASPPPPDLATDEAQQRLAHLEALLSGALFDSTPTVEDEPPKKRKKTNHTQDQAVESESSQAEPQRVKDVAQPLQQAEQVVFRLFSTQKAPQAIVIREAESPPLFVADPRIRAVEDEPDEVVRARRTAIEALAVDGETIRSQSLKLPPTPPPSSRLLHRRVPSLSRSPSTRATLPLPRLAYLNAILPFPYSARSPAPVPSDDPPRTPHEGLIRTPPFTVKGARGVPVRNGLRRLDPHTLGSRIVPILKVEEEAPRGVRTRKQAQRQKQKRVEGTQLDEDDAKKPKQKRVSKARRARARKHAGLVA
ncbi:hypothetical protein JCM1841_004912 [Sporobolomyces salmonicolor]